MRDWPPNVDLIRVAKKLHTRARRLVSRLGAPDIFDGVSSDDVVQDVFAEFLHSPTGLDWKPWKGSLEALLWTVTKHNVLTHLQRHRRFAASLDDKAIEHRTLSDDPCKQYEQKDLVDRLTQLADSDPELKSYVAGARELDEGHNRNQQIASNANIPVKTAQNCLRRLRRRAAREGLTI